MDFYDILLGTAFGGGSGVSPAGATAFVFAGGAGDAGPAVTAEQEADE